MAVDVYSENLMGMSSPSFSFSRDLEEKKTSSNPTNDHYLCRLDHSLADSTFDFAFNVDSNITFQSSTADELFSDGKIIPTCIKQDEIKRVEQLKPVVPCLDPQPTESAEPRKKSLKEFLEDSSEEEEPNTLVAKSFWKFRRSNSLNCDRNQRKGLNVFSRSGSTGKFLEKILEEEKPISNSRFFWKFSRSSSINSEHVNDANVVASKGVVSSSKTLRRSHSTSDHYSKSDSSKPFRRSNSTGSAPNHVGNKKQQNTLKQQQQQFAGNTKSSQKGQVKNSRGYSFGNYYNNSVKISPVLNLPSPYISRVSVDLFGIGSLFCNGSKDRKKKK